MPTGIVKIGDQAFSETDLLNVVISEGVTHIGRAAFKFCYSLQSVTLPSTLISIDDEAFRVCSSLTSFTIPSGVSNIVGNILNASTNIETITVDAGNATYYAQDGMLASYSGDLVAWLPKKAIGDIVVPNTIKDIGYAAFGNCENMTNILIPSSVEKIDCRAFAACAQLSSIKFEGNVPPQLYDMYGTFVTFSSSAKMYVPKGSLSAYQTKVSPLSRHKNRKV